MLRQEAGRQLADRCRGEQVVAERMEGGAGLSRRNSVKGGSAAGSRRGSQDSEPAATSGLFGQQKPLKKSKPVSTVKITFMGKPMVGILQLVKASLNQDVFCRNYLCL